MLITLKGQILNEETYMVNLRIDTEEEKDITSNIATKYGCSSIRNLSEIKRWMYYFNSKYNFESFIKEIIKHPLYNKN